MILHDKVPGNSPKKLPMLLPGMAIGLLCNTNSRCLAVWFEEDI
jgi:hypothetical protein